MNRFDTLAKKILGENYIPPYLSRSDIDRLDRKYARLSAEDAKAELLVLLQNARLKNTGVNIDVVEILGDKILGGKARELDMSLDELLDAVGEEIDAQLNYIEGSKGQLVTYIGL